MEGWLKLHRKIQDHWLYEKNRPKTKYEAWLHILMNVNYKSGKSMIRGVIYDCNPGQCLFSLETWAKHFNWSVQQVRTFIAQLKKDEMITTEGMQYTTKLTVCNWVSYQGDSTDEQHTEQHADNKPLTDGQQTDNKPLTTIEESKEGKEGKEGKEDIYAQFIQIFNDFSGKKIRVFDEKAKKQFRARIKEGFTVDDFKTAIKNCKQDPFHIENKQYLTPEFITRADKLQKYLIAPSKTITDTEFKASLR